MITWMKYEEIMVASERNERVLKVLENYEAVMVYFPNADEYMAISKEEKGGDGYGYYHNSTKGKHERCKKAFEKYSPKTMEYWKKVMEERANHAI